jgi:hypothetical protein
MHEFRSQLRLLACTAAGAALCACSRPPLSFQDQSDIYRQAFVQSGSAVFGAPFHPVLILDPRLLPEAATPLLADTVATLLGPVASKGLLDARVLRQMRTIVCAPATKDNECLNGVRGIAVRMSSIHRQSARRVTLWTLVNPVQAAGDNTQLERMNRLLLYEGIWRDGHWRVRPIATGTRT